LLGLKKPHVYCFLDLVQHIDKVNGNCTELLPLSYLPNGQAVKSKYDILLCFVYSIAQGNGSNASKHEAFQTWFVNHGGIMKGIEIHSFPEMGNGFRTLPRVEENDLVMKIPSREYEKSSK
jgi:hypothetical protein